MEDYVVRLAGNHPPATVPVPAATRPPRRRRGKVLRLVVLALVVAAVVNPSALRGVLDAAVERVRAPVDSLGGEAQLRRATTVLNAHYSAAQTYDLTAAELRELAPDVSWDRTVRLTVCHGGAAAVAAASTVRGTVSRLFVRGDDVGDVVGDEGCPASADDLAPWSY